MTKEELVALAVEAMGHAYVPYSGYQVGAALLTSDGRVYQGCGPWKIPRPGCCPVHQKQMGG